jgi:hypothetical protein
VVQILPAYAEDLIVEDAAIRIKAIKLLGAVFSVRLFLPRFFQLISCPIVFSSLSLASNMFQVGNFSRDFASVFAEFKRRSLDKEQEVRCDGSSWKHICNFFLIKFELPQSISAR